MTIEEQIASAVEEAVQRVLGQYLRRLGNPEPLVYTVAQAAAVLQVSEDTVSRLIKRGLLERIPHLEGRVLVPKIALERIVNDALNAEDAGRARSA